MLFYAAHQILWQHCVYPYDINAGCVLLYFNVSYDIISTKSEVLNATSSS